MRRRRVIVVGVAVVACLVFAGLGTTALWRAQVAPNPGTVTTGNLILLGGDGSSFTKNYALTSFGKSSLAPGVTLQSPVVLKNSGTTPMGVTLKGVATTLTSGSTRLDQSLQLTIRNPATSSDCAVGPASNQSTVLFSGLPSDSATFTTTVRLAAGASLPLCIQGSLSASAPQPSDAPSFTLNFTFRGDQLR